MAYVECKKYVTCPMCKGAGGNHHLDAKSLTCFFYLFCNRNILTGKSATCTAIGPASLSPQHENAKPARITRSQNCETTYHSGASGDPRSLALSDWYIRLN